MGRARAIVARQDQKGDCAAGGSAIGPTCCSEMKLGCIGRIWPIIGNLVQDL